MHSGCGQAQLARAQNTGGRAKIVQGSARNGGVLNNVARREQKRGVLLIRDVGQKTMQGISRLGYIR